MLTMTRTKLPDPLAPRRGRLSGVGALQGFPFAALREIEGSMVEKKYPGQSSIFRENDHAESIWFVKQGHIKEVQHSKDGKEKTLCTAGAEGMFGTSAFQGGEYGSHCVAVTDVTTLSFPVRNFLSVMGRYPEMTRIILSKVSKLLGESKHRQGFSHENAEKRVLRVLVEMSEEFGETIPLTRRDISSLAGTAVETCIRIITRLRNAGLITGKPSEQGKFTVKSTESLKEWLEAL